LTELDCLASISIVSSTSESTMSRPNFIDYKGSFKNSSLLDIKGMRHPCVTLGSNKSFIPNDTYISPNES
jgi:DNA mismatch repair protein MSH6